MAKVVVTGPSGHLGTCLLPKLIESGQQVRAVCFGPTPSLDGLNVERVTGDVRDPDSLHRAFEGQDFLIHLESCPQTVFPL